MSTLDDVISTVLRAREDGPDALAAVAMSFGSAMELGTLGNTALKARLAETRAALEATEATVTTLRTERDAASAAAKAARQRMEEVREQCDRARDDAEMCARQRDEARSRASMIAQDLARAVQEREAFSLRLSAAERERDEARAERDASDERWATVCRECDVALAERDAVQALHAEIVAIRADFGHQRDITDDALRERDEARAALDLARESAREARAEIAQSLALVDEARAALDAALARPTYEARTTMPTPDECDAHRGANWLIVRRYGGNNLPWVSTWLLYGGAGEKMPEDVPPPTGGRVDVWVPIGPDGLPCAWPVVP